MGLFNLITCKDWFEAIFQLTASVQWRILDRNLEFISHQDMLLSEPLEEPVLSLGLCVPSPV